MRLKGDAAQEYRFALIARLSAEGKKQSEIAAVVQCSQSWVNEVLKRHKLLGGGALKVKGKALGKAPKLSGAELSNLQQMLLSGALHHGFETDNWSRERVWSLIKDKFGVSFHVSHMSKLLRQIGFTLQKPLGRSYRKDDGAEREWKDKTLPALKKST
jgi:transposase